MARTISSAKGNENDVFVFEPSDQIDPFDQMALSSIAINEAEEEFLLSVTALGMRREDFYVSVDKRVITIIAGGKQGAPYFKNRAEQDLSEFVRTCELPANADPLLTSATFINGKLEIHIPKGENTEEKPFLIYVY